MLRQDSRERVLGQRGLVGKLSLTTTQITVPLTSSIVKVGATKIMKYRTKICRTFCVAIGIAALLGAARDQHTYWAQTVNCQASKNLTKSPQGVERFGAGD